jgi:cytochrome c-type biogenesis protein CcmH
MKKWLPLMAALVIALVALVAGSSGGQAPTPAERTASIANRVKCPTCQGLTVEQSKTPLAVDIRSQIERQVDLGRTDSEIIGGLTKSYGNTILTNPPATGAGAVVWVAPIAFVVLAFIGLAAALRRWSKASLRVVEDDDLAAVRRAQEATA